jgi:phosphate transport system permease protein
MTVAIEAEASAASRREIVQSSATRYYRRKMILSGIRIYGLYAALVAALVPLGDILYNVIRRGAPYMSWRFLSTPQKLPDLFHQSDIGGISNGITGTAEIFGIAVVIAVPLAVTTAIALYESHGRVMARFRTLLEVMVGMPSILFGVFIYSYVVTRMHYQLTELAGSLALAVLMIPLITVSCEVALRTVPQAYVEAALALGAKRSTVMRRVVLPYAAPRILTGIMLAGARAIGETAPILFVIGNNLGSTWDPLKEVSSLPTIAYNDLNSYYTSLQNEVWGIALVMIAAVLVLNLASRFIVARTSKGRT